MSLLETQNIACPSCASMNKVDVFHSINADRRPDLRDAALARSLQQQTCPHCQTQFRIDPEFNYLDMGRGQWLAVHPLENLGNWEAVVAADSAVFDKSYGAGASASAREIGESLRVRVAFGWAAFREKLVTAEAGLDDVELELLKIAILRSQDDMPLSESVELRLVDVVDGKLVMCWLEAAQDEVVQTILVPMEAYDEIAADTGGWAALRQSLSGGPYVDMQRMMA